MASNFDFNIKSSADPSAVDDLQAKIDALQAAVDQLTGTTAAPEADTSGVDEVSTAAGDATVALEEVSAIDVAPTVDTSGLDDLSGAASGAGSSVSGISDDADSAAGSIGGMVGKATASLPGIGQALGPLRKQFVGMFKEIGEGLASGQMNWGKLLAQGAAMAVIEVAVKGVTEELKKAAAIDAFRAKEVDDFTKSLEKGGDQVSALVDRLTKAGKIDVVTQLTGKTDLTPVLAKWGITVDQFATAVLGGQEGLDRFTTAVIASGVSQHDVAVITMGAKDAADQYGKAQDTAANFAKVFGNANDEVKAKTDAAAKATADAKLTTDQAKQTADDMKAAVDNETTAYKNQITAIQGTIDKEKALITVNRDAADAQINLDDKTVAYNDSLKGLAQAVADANGDQAKIRLAYDGTVTSAAALADAQVELKTKQDEANGVTTTAKDKQDAWNQAMLTASATANGPAQQAIIDYIAKANGIPTNVATEITAAVAAGDLDKANALLADASKARSASVSVDVDQAALQSANTALDNLARDRGAKIIPVPGNTSGYGHNASGTSNWRGGPTWINEAGPEIVDLPQGTRIYPNGVTPPAQGATGTVVYNFTINGATMTPDEVIAAAKRYERLNGAGWRGG